MAGWRTTGLAASIGAIVAVAAVGVLVRASGSELATDTAVEPYRLIEVDPAGFVRFADDEAGMNERREALIDEVWGEVGPPTDADSTGIIEPGVDREGFAIVHHGHADIDMRRTVETLHAAGYATVEIQMPRHPEKGRSAAGHDAMFAELGGDAMRLFVDPSIRALNAFNELDPDVPVLMIGLSGGGWATHVVAAIDERVDLSIPVAGAMPLYARPFAGGVNSTGDAEQTWEPIFGEGDTDGDGVPDSPTGVASWLEVFAMATSSGRQQVQVLNLADPCCFGGGAASSYAPWLHARFSGWSLVMDTTTTEHSISNYTRSAVVAVHAEALASR